MYSQIQNELVYPNTNAKGVLNVKCTVGSYVGGFYNFNDSRLNKSPCKDFNFHKSLNPTTFQTFCVKPLDFFSVKAFSWNTWDKSVWKRVETYFFVQLTVDCSWLHCDVGLSSSECVDTWLKMGAP